MTISQVYDHYRIMPNLQVHMYRVSGVAKLICDNLIKPVDGTEVVTACLLHDMGNIIKFNLQTFPQFLQPEGIEYWQDVQEWYVDRYGQDEHEANVLIASELGVSERIKDLIRAIGFASSKEDVATGDVAKMICEYGDCRVTPFGVVLLEDRLQDLERRYAPLYPSEEDARMRQEFREYTRLLEQRIFADCQLKPEDITEEKVQNVIPTLKNWVIA
jgi:hypothetical protein